MLQLTSKQFKQAQLIGEQWFAMEDQWEKMNQLIVTKAQKINNVIKLDRLSKLAEVLPHDETSATQAKTG